MDGDKDDNDNYGNLRILDNGELAMAFPLKTNFQGLSVFSLPASWFRDVSTFLNDLWIKKQTEEATITTLWSAKPVFTGSDLTSIVFTEYQVRGAVQSVAVVQTVTVAECDCGA
jgi:hypothetical protein